MKPYILLTPGPLTTSETVKEAMLTDWCTWDADYNVHIVEEIRKSLVALATKQTDEYTSVLLQGSGTYCVEAVIGSTVKPGQTADFEQWSLWTVWEISLSITVSTMICWPLTKRSRCPSAM